MAAAALCPAAQGAAARPDLAVRKVTGPASTAPGQRLQVSAVVANRARVTRHPRVTFYLSRSTAIRGATALGTLRAGRIGAHHSKRVARTVVTPDATAAGSYRVVACASRRGSRRRACAAATRPITVAPRVAAVPVTIDTPPEGAVTSSTTPEFRGHAVPGQFVTLTIASGANAVQELRALAGADGAWSASPSPLGEGAYAATASQPDSFGRTQRGAPRNFRVDRTPPSPAITAPANGTTAHNTEPTFSGTASTGAGDTNDITLLIYSGASATGTPIVTDETSASGGSWSLIIDTELGDGTYTAVAQQPDAAGNVGRSAPRTFQVDTIGPTVDLDQPADGSSTNDTTPSFQGSASSGATDSQTVTVKVYTGTTATGTPRVLQATRSGTSWSVAPASALPEGTYTAQAEQDDTTGNVGLSAPHTFRVDTTNPALTIAHPTAGMRTKDTTPAIDGAAGTAAGDSSTVAVKVFAGTGTAGTLEQSTSTTAGGGSWAISAATLGEGTHTVEARQSDAAGNQQVVIRTFTVDTTAPAVSVTSPAGTIADSTPTVSGTAGTATGDQQAITVRIYPNAGGTGTPVATLSATASAGSWSVTTSALGDGTYSAVAEQSDSAGNTGTSAPHAFTIDATGPAVTLAHPAVGVVTADRTPAYDGSTDDPSPVTVKVYSGSAVGGTVADTAGPAVPSGTSWSTTGASLGDGTYTAQAEQTDAATNTGKSTPHTFKVDATAPSLTLSAGSSPAVVHVVADDANFDSLACTVDGSPATVSPTSPSTHSAEGDVTTSGSGSHTVQCTVTDLAGTQTTKSRAAVVDTAAPAVGLDSPADGASLTDPVPTFSGPAGTAAGDDPSVTVKVYSGPSATGVPVRTFTAPVSGTTWSGEPSSAIPEGTYTAQAEQTDASGNRGTSAAHTFTIAPATMLTAGDIGGCETGNDAAGTAAILRANSNALVQTLGDNVYGNALYADGTLADFQNCYGPNWGTEKPRTKPGIGNHEYNDPNANGYFDYFNGIGSPLGVAGPRTKGYYSYDLGSWHVVVLNSNCTQVGGCGVGSDQETFLQNDLLTHPAACTMAVWHHSLFTSDAFTGQATSMKPLYTDLYNAGADVVVSAHSHEYERFRPQDPTGVLDTARGLTEFVVGTGGESHSKFGTIKQNSVVHDNTTFGVMKFTLHQGSYSWQFLPTASGTFTDSGTASCH